ncbi:M48 family metallopeptidase [Streptomyces sp. NBC_01465]|uniref:M48 family metallopeptidase n=1 Tax=Streptomyces sp. NBC_01465 TaxID=2903878 RepID=UPI002E35D601|nr:M48 family metallopeptidase [Streptomyces sp. NBC_01465]
MVCPECGAAVPKQERFVSWCAECGWNVDPGTPEPDRGRLDRLYLRLAHRNGERLYAELAQDADARPRRDLSSVLAYALALAVHAVTLTCLVGGVLLVVLGWSTVVLPIFGILLLTTGVVLCPRPRKLPPHDPVLRRAEAPALFALVDEVATVVATRGVDAVVVDASFNASVSTYGLRGRRVLTIGLGLWEVLSPQERIALLGHELGHYAHGDLRHGGVVAPAHRSLHLWYGALAPEPRPDLMGTFVNLVSLVPRWFVYGVLVLLTHLTFRASQRSEYLADRAGARAGSSEAAVAMQDRFLIGGSVEAELRRESVAAQTRGRRGDARAAEQGLWERIAEHAATVPEREYERLRRAGALRGHSEDTTHPATHLRRRLLTEAEPCAASVVADEVAVAAELADARRRVARTVIRDFAG